jgi:hypothetical protein
MHSVSGGGGGGGSTIGKNGKKVKDKDDVSFKTFFILS